MIKLSIKLLIIFFIFSFIAIEYIIGSKWTYTSTRDISLFKKIDDDIKKLPVIAKVKNGTLLEVKECYFDKSDAYILVQSSQYAGYSDSIRQKYIHSWRLRPSFELSIFLQRLDCWRLTSQFYLES